jgi:hypothetical protein
MIYYVYDQISICKHLHTGHEEIHVSLEDVITDTMPKCLNIFLEVYCHVKRPGRSNKNNYTINTKILQSIYI